MATMNFSVPEDVKHAFNETFHGHNKSAIITALMRRAVEEARQRERRARAMDDLIARRSERPAASPEEIRRARDELRSCP